ncbi:MAG: M15 family metallopeptidase, partial [Pseudomonadota bacterium]
FSPNTTMEQRQNRLLLLAAATKAGLVNYGHEWWHYSYGDKVHAKVNNLDYAIYGLATDKNNPILSITIDDYFKQIAKLKQS